MKHKLLKNRKGETLVETLVAILIFTMASICLFSTVTSAARVNGITRELDMAIQEQILTAERASSTNRLGDAQVTLSINGTTLSQVPVQIFGDEAEEGGGTPLYSYFKNPAGGTRP